MKFGDAGEFDGPARSFASSCVPSKVVAPLADETSVPDYCTEGAKVFATGLRGGIILPFAFEATIVKVRSQFPRLHVCESVCVSRLGDGSPQHFGRAASAAS